MSTKKTENPIVEAVYSISRQVAAALNIGDAGKVDSFINKIERDCLKAIKGHEKNIENIKYNLNNQIDDIKEQLEDAEVELKEAYSAIPLNRIVSNQDQTEFKDEYLRNIAHKKSVVNKLNKEIEKAKDYAQEKEYIENLGAVGINGLEKAIKDAKEIVSEVTKKA